MANASERNAKLWLRAFGVPGLGRAGEDAAFPLGMKSLAMLVYLAEASPRPVTREQLVELLWERVEPAQGKGSLRQEIRRIKKVVGDDLFEAMLDVADAHVALRPGVVDYDGAAASAAAEADDPDEIARLMAICDGDFLASNTARAEAFQQWAAERRAYLRDLVVAALTRLGFMDIEAGRTERAQAAADRIAQIDPLHEKGHEVTIRAHLASGRRGQARAHFERFRAYLLRELATEPDQSLAALVAPGPDFDAAAAPAKPAAAKRGGERPMIAVMNVTRGDGGDQAYLADGVAEQLVANLSRSAWIRVAALNMAPYPAAVGEIDRSQRDLRDFADYVLRVDVRSGGGNVAITATLNRIEDNATVFSDRMENRLDDILALQRDVALRIASIFEPIVVEAEAKREAGIVWTGKPQNVDHWRLVMRARWLFWKLTPTANGEARVLLERAHGISPEDGPTICLLAFTHMLDAWSDWTNDVDRSVREAKRWGQKAVNAAPNDAWAQFTLGVMCSTSEEIEQAKTRMAHALRLSPSLIIAKGELARLHAFCGETAEAQRLADEALALSPYDQQSGLWVRTKSLAFWIDGKLDQALELIDFGLVVRPGWFQNHVLRAAILAELGRVADARKAFEGARAKVGDYSEAALRIGHPFSDAALHKRFVSALNKAGGAYAT